MAVVFALTQDYRQAAAAAAWCKEQLNETEECVCVCVEVEERKRGGNETGYRWLF